MLIDVLSGPGSAGALPEFGVCWPEQTKSEVNTKDAANASFVTVDTFTMRCA